MPIYNGVERIVTPRWLARRALLQTVVYPLLDFLPEDQFDHLKFLTLAFGTTHPTQAGFPYSPSGYALLEFVRAVCIEHNYTNLTHTINMIQMDATDLLDISG